MVGLGVAEQLPWLAAASADRSVRVWNYETRTCIAAKHMMVGLWVYASSCQSWTLAFCRCDELQEPQTCQVVAMVESLAVYVHYIVHSIFVGRMEDGEQGFKGHKTFNPFSDCLTCAGVCLTPAG